MLPSLRVAAHPRLLQGGTALFDITTPINTVRITVVAATISAC